MAQYKLGLRLPSLFEARYHQDPILRREPSNDAQYSVDLSAANGGLCNVQMKRPPGVRHANTAESA
jgi:hypothetical protein